MSSFVMYAMLNVMLLACSLQRLDGMQLPPETTHRDYPCQQEANGRWKARKGRGAITMDAHAKRISRDKHDLCTLGLCSREKLYCKVDYLDWRFESESLPEFNPSLFLRRMAGKTISFFGDSLTWQHFNHLTCVLHADTTIEVEDVERPCGNFTLNELTSKRACGTFGFTRVKFTNGATFQFQNANVDMKAISKFGPSTMQYCSKADKIDHRIYEADFMIYNEGAWQTSWEELKSVMEGRLQYIRSQFRGKLFFRDYSAAHFESGDFRSENPKLESEVVRANESSPEKCTDNVEPNNVDVFRSSIARGYMMAAGARPLCTHSVTLSAPAVLHAGYRGDVRGDCRHWCNPSPVIDIWNIKMADAL